LYRIINKKKRYATMMADFIGNILFLPRLIKKKGDVRPDEIKDILVIRTAYIGDVVMALPLLKPLRDRFKKARISFLTSARAMEVLENNPYVDEIITYDPFWFYPSGKIGYLDFIKGIRGRQFDLVIETRGDIREIAFLVLPLKARYKVSYDAGGGGYLLTHVVPYQGTRHRVEYHLDIAKYLGCDVGSHVEWGIYLTEDEKVKVVELLKNERIELDRPIVAIHPGARKELKCWSPEGYAAVADIAARELGAAVLLTGAPEELPLVKRVEGMMKERSIVIAGRTTLRELAGVISHCSLFICNDSSPMHIAAAMKIPTVAIFGPSKSIETGPYGNIHRVVEKDFPCRYTCDEDVCHFKSHNQCIKEISTNDVFMAVMKMLKIKEKEKFHGKNDTKSRMI